MHSHMYLAEADIPPVSPAVVAGRQCLLADPALTNSDDNSTQNMEPPRNLTLLSLESAFHTGAAPSSSTLALPQGPPVTPMSVNDTHLCATQILQCPFLSIVIAGFRTWLFYYSVYVYCIRSYKGKARQ